MKSTFRSGIFRGLSATALGIALGSGMCFTLPLSAGTLGTSYSVRQDNQVITGDVKDSEGTPLAGVTVRLKGTKIGTMTDTDGVFRITIPKDMKKGTLTFSYVGMKDKEVPFTSTTGTFTVTLEDDTELLNEVVVTGYQTISKERATESFACSIL